MIGPSPRYINDGVYVGGFERSDIELLLDTMEKNYTDWVNSMAPLIMKNPDRPELAAELADSFCATDPVIFRQFAEVTFYSDNREDLPKLNKPVLILQCTDDMISPYSVGAYVSNNIPQSTIRMMKATGHCPHVSHPEETIAVITEYLRTSNY